MTKERFDQLLEAQLPTLLLQAKLLRHNIEDAEDLLQDTIVLMLEKRNYYQNKNFGAWAYTLLLNLKRNLSRKVELVEYSDKINELEEIFYDCTEQVLDIRKSLEEVSATMQETTELFLQGYLYEEIAQQQAIGLGTVKSRINRARKQLQTLLSDYR